MKYECKHNKSEFSGKLYKDAVNLLHVKDKINLPQGAGNWQHPSWRPLCPFPGPSGRHGVWAAMPQAAAFLPNKWQPSYPGLLCGGSDGPAAYSQQTPGKSSKSAKENHLGV